MPKPSAKPDTDAFRSTNRIQQDNPATLSDDTASDEGWHKLSFLYGATCNGGSSDMGPSEPVGQSYNPDIDAYECRRELRRHTIDQGCSTFSFPQKP